MPVLPRFGGYYLFPPRRDLERAGYTGDALRKLFWQIEPTCVAHRLGPQRTWRYTAAQDRFVPRGNAQALARAARLDEDHRVSHPGDQYIPSGKQID